MAEGKTFVRPTRGYVIVLDDQPEEIVDGGIIVQRRIGVFHHDFSVVATSGEPLDFGVGDCVVISDPNEGERVMLDGIVYRKVPVSSVIAVKEPEGDEK